MCGLENNKDFRGPLNFGVVQHFAKYGAISLMIAANCFMFPLHSSAILSSEQRVAADAWNIVDQLYVDRTFNNNDWMKIRQSLIKRDYSTRDQVYSAISDEMLGKLGDKYTRFIVPAKYEALRDAVVGLKNEDVSGIGVTLSVDKNSNKVKIVETIEGSPAAELGLKRNSIIVEVNKIRTDVAQTTPDEVAALLRGPIGTKVEMKVVEGGGAEKVVVVERRRFVVKPVTSGVVGHSGFIRIKQFDTKTSALVKAAVEANFAAGAACTVVDLRDNAGGYFSGGVESAGVFLPKDSVEVYLTNKDGNGETFAAKEDGIDTTRPLFVLVNENTASASEIMTGALKDNGRAKVVGDKTFGKGVVQTVVPIYDGSAVAVTVARYETPSHLDINKKGIAPDAPPGSPLCPDPYPDL